MTRIQKGLAFVGAITGLASLCALTGCTPAPEASPTPAATIGANPAAQQQQKMNSATAMPLDEPKPAGANGDMTKGVGGALKN